VSLIVNVVLKLFTFSLSDKLLVNIANHLFERSVLDLGTTLILCCVFTLPSTLLFFWLIIFDVWCLLRCLVFIRLRFLLFFLSVVLS
jgi:hypothetical protein